MTGRNQSHYFRHGRAALDRQGARQPPAVMQVDRVARPPPPPPTERTTRAASMFRKSTGSRADLRHPHEIESRSQTLNERRLQTCMVQQITPQQLAAKLAAGEPVYLLDVRQPEE